MGNEASVPSGPGLTGVPRTSAKAQNPRGVHLRRTAEYHKTGMDCETYVKYLLNAAIDRNYLSEGFYFHLPHSESTYIEALQRLINQPCSFFVEGQPVVYLELATLEQRGGFYQRWKHRKDLHETAMNHLRGAFYKLQRADNVGVFFGKTLNLDLYEYQHDIAIVGEAVILNKARELYGDDMNLIYDAPYLRFLF